MTSLTLQQPYVSVTPGLPSNPGSGTLLAVMGFLLPSIGLGILALLGCRAWRVWLDARQRERALAQRVRRALVGAVVSDRYWWGARRTALLRLLHTADTARAAASPGQ